MAEVKISDLTAGTTLDGTELVPIVQGGTTVKMTTQDIADLGGGGGVRKYVNTTLQSAAATGETLMGSYLIPANTFTSNGSFEFLIKQGASIATGAQIQTKVYFNTSNTLTGATLLATSTNNTGGAYYNFVRNAFISSNSVSILSASLAVNLDITSGTLAQSVITLDVTSDKYFLVTMTPSSPASLEVRGVKFFQYEV